MQLAIQTRLYRLLCATWRHRYLLVIPPLLLPIMGFFLSNAAPKIYDNHTSFLVQESATLNPFLKDLSVDSQIQQRMKALDTLLHSRHILQKVAVSEGLYPATPSDYEKDQIINKLSSNLTVALFGSDLIRISYRSSRPEGMDSLLRSVRNIFIDQLLAPERSSMSNSEQFLLGQLENQRAQLNKAESALADFKSKHVMQLPSLFTNNVSSISELRQLISQKEIELAGQDAVMSGLHTQLILNNPLILQIEKDIIQKKRTLGNLQSRYTARHSKVIIAQTALDRLEQELAKWVEITTQIDDIEGLERFFKSSKQNNISSLFPELSGNISKNIEKALASLNFTPNNEIEAAKLKHSRLTQELSQLRQQHDDLLTLINNSGDIEQTLQSLSRDLKVQEKVYQETLDRYERAKVTGALGSYEQKDRIKIIDQAYVPSAPSNMPVAFFIVLGAIAGIGLGVSSALVLEITDSRLRYMNEVENIAKVPVLSRIPKIKDDHYLLDIDEFIEDKPKKSLGCFTKFHRSKTKT